MEVTSDNREGKRPSPADNADKIPNMNSQLKDATDVECDECENKVFVEAMMLKKVSRFVTGSDRDSLTPIPVIACSKCGHVNKEFIPKV